MKVWRDEYQWSYAELLKIIDARNTYKRRKEYREENDIAKYATGMMVDEVLTPIQECMKGKENNIDKHIESLKIEGEETIKVLALILNASMAYQPELVIIHSIREKNNIKFLREYEGQCEEQGENKEIFIYTEGEIDKRDKTIKKRRYIFDIIWGIIKDYNNI